MDFNSTVKGSLLEGFYPEGWDFKKIDECCSHAPEAITERQAFWNKDFNPIECKDLGEFDVKMGHEIANEIKKANVYRYVYVPTDERPSVPPSASKSWRIGASTVMPTCVSPVTSRRLPGPNPRMGE